MFDWNDLRHLLAVARRGSTLATARELGVNQSTVHRRVAELEPQVGLRLVHRHPTGYRPTEMGEQLLPVFADVEESVAKLWRAILGLQHELTGTVRLTCPEPVLSRIVASGFIDRRWRSGAGPGASTGSGVGASLVPPVSSGPEDDASQRLRAAGLTRAGVDGAGPAPSATVASARSSRSALSHPMAHYLPKVRRLPEDARPKRGQCQVDTGPEATEAGAGEAQAEA